MGFSRQLFREHAFLLTTLSDSIDDRGLLNHVLALNQEVNGIQSLRELADCTGVKDVSGLSVRGTTQCAQTEQAKPGSKLAICVPAGSPLLFGLARAYQSFAEKTRHALAVFTGMEEAVRWLSTDSTDAETLLSLLRQKPNHNSND